MGRPRTLNRYPSNYFDLFERTVTEGSFIIPGYPTRAAALEARRDLYGFRRAAEAESHPDARQWLSYTIFVDPTLDSDTWQIRIEPPDAKPAAQIVADALAR